MSEISVMQKFLPMNMVTFETSQEWLGYWGLLPDPDPVLLRTGQDCTIFTELLVDAHVFACYQSRKAGILTNEWKLSFPSENRNMVKYFGRIMDTLPINEIIAQFLDAPFYGFSVNEIIWEKWSGRWIPKTIEQKPNEWFSWSPEQELRFLSMEHPIEGSPLPPFKFLVPRNFPSFKNPYGIRILSRCFWPVAFKKAGFKYWAKFIEKFGIPWLIGKVPSGADDTQRQAMLDMLVAMVQNSVAVISENESVEALQVKSKDGGEISFHEMINAANGEISKAILTQTLTTEVGDKGAYAAAQSHSAVRDDVCAMDRKLIADTMNKLFDMCTYLNFNNAIAPRFVFIEEDDAKEPTARRDNTLYAQGVRFTPEYYQRAYNLRKNEFTIEKPEKPKPLVGKPDEDGKEEGEDKVKDKAKTEEMEGSHGDLW